MTNLIVVRFKDNAAKAGEVLDELGHMENNGKLHLTDAVAVHMRHDGALIMDQRYDLDDKLGAAAVGVLFGSLVAAILAVPFVAAGVVTVASVIALGAAGGGAMGATVGLISDDWTKEGFGISDNFVREVGSTIQPGDSAIFAFLSAEDTDQVVNEFEGLGGHVITTTLSEESKTKIEEVLNQASKGSKT